MEPIEKRSCPADAPCAALLREWLEQLRPTPEAVPAAAGAPGLRQGSLFTSSAYQEELALIRNAAELAGAWEHLEYSIFRRYENTLTRAERLRLENTIANTLFKIERYVGRLAEGPERTRLGAELERVRGQVAESKERAEKLRQQARRAELKLSQLGSLTPEGFEEFVAEVFEALGHEVEHVGGTDDRGIDLKVVRAGLRAIVQCKYHKKGVIGSPELQKFLGAVHGSGSHKGYFVTTSTFSLAAERFAADHPIELIDGPRLVELVQDALGPGARREPEPAWF